MATRSESQPLNANSTALDIPLIRGTPVYGPEDLFFKSCTGPGRLHISSFAVPLPTSKHRTESILQLDDSNLCWGPPQSAHGGFQGVIYDYVLATTAGLASKDYGEEGTGELLELRVEYKQRVPIPAKHRVIGEVVGVQSGEEGRTVMDLEARIEAWKDGKWTLLSFCISKRVFGQSFATTASGSDSEWASAENLTTISDMKIDYQADPNLHPGKLITKSDLRPFHTGGGTFFWLTMISPSIVSKFASLRSRTEPRLCGSFELQRDAAGSNGLVSPSLLYSILDHKMGSTVHRFGKPRGMNATAYMNISVKELPPAPCNLYWETRLEKQEGRKVFASSVVKDRPDGKLLVECKALFVLMNAPKVAKETKAKL